MQRSFLPVLGLVILASALRAAELPIVQVTIGPDGALVERAGVLPAGDDVVSGLPIGIDPARLTVTIAGLDTPPAIRLEMPSAAPLPPPDAAWLTRLAAAQAAFETAQPALDLAELRARFAQAVVAMLPTVAAAEVPVAEGEQPQPQAIKIDRPATADTPLPSASVQKRMLRFVTDNLTTAANERSAALRVRNGARAQLIALDDERERLRPIQRLTASLPLPGAGGREVRLRYTVERASWAPVYRIEVAGGSATLVHEALIDVPRDQGWTQGKLELITRQPSEEFVLKDLLVPVLELGDEVVTERVTGKRRAIGRHGGSRGSESAVDAGLRAISKLTAADGSWPAGAWTAQTTALATLTFLGAGYDHNTPSKYKQVVRPAVTWLADHAVAGDLSGQAVTAMALAEAYAMTQDPAIRPQADLALATLVDRVVGRHELAVAIYRRGPMAGPELMAWVTMAAKSASAAGLDSQRTQQLFAAVDALIPELEGHADRDEARVTGLLIDVFRGRRGTRQPPVSEWLERVPVWLQEGRPELLYFATLGLFQYGGDAWSLWNATVHDRLVAINRVGERSGFLAASPTPMGEGAAMVLLTLPLEAYYRYRQVRDGESSAGSADPAGGSALFADRRNVLSIPELAPLANLAQAAKNWPLRIAAGEARLIDGQRVRIALSRTALPGKVGLHAVPLDGPGAWRELATSNPLAVPMLAGPAEVVVDGERLGETELPFTEPGKPLNLALGRDDRIEVARSEERSDDEAWGKRTRTTTVTYRITAPVGLYEAIQIDEAMPKPAEGSIQLISVDPAIVGEELDRRLIEDPVWHVQIGLGAQPAVGHLVWQLRHPIAVRPQVQKQATPAVSGTSGTSATSATEAQFMKIDDLEEDKP